MIKISLLSQKEHCAKLFQLRESLGNVCRGQGKTSVSCLHGNPKVLNLPSWHKHQQSLWTSEDWLRLAGSEQLNSRGSYILTTPALVEVKFTPRSWDTGTQPQHCIQNQTQHFPLATLFHQPCKPQQMLHSLPGVPLLIFRKDKNCKKKKTRLKPP